MCDRGGDVIGFISTPICCVRVSSDRPARRDPPPAWNPGAVGRRPHLSRRVRCTRRRYGGRSVERAAAAETAVTVADDLESARWARSRAEWDRRVAAWRCTTRADACQLYLLCSGAELSDWSPTRAERPNDMYWPGRLIAGEPTSSGSLPGMDDGRAGPVNR